MEDMISPISAGSFTDSPSVPTPPAFNKEAAAPVDHAADAEAENDVFLPTEPDTIEDSGLSEFEIEALVLKYLLTQGSRTGREISQQLKLPFGLISTVMQLMKSQMFVGYKSEAAVSDYHYQLTPSGIDRARAYAEHSTYCGAAPVGLSEYADSIVRQSIKNQTPTFEQVQRAFDDLLLSPVTLSQVGQAINAARSLFLYGHPGNGKTSIAVRAIGAVGDAIWIPRSIIAGGQIIRLYDSNCHQELPLKASESLLSADSIDDRWIRIKRPTVVAGGELDFGHLELTLNKLTGICEAPLHLKSNCGCLVVDDFGRQRISVAELLNRWIVPLEKGLDFMTLPSGQQIQVPFDQLVVFSTNLEPKELCDEAFLRRIPYKVELHDPSEEQFRELVRRRAPRFGFVPEPEVIDHMVNKHFKGAKRPFRYCYVDDVLTQIRDFCEFHRQPLELTRDKIDIAVNNYFAGL